MIRRPPRSTLSSSSAASDVYKRQALPLDLPGIAVTLSSPEHLLAMKMASYRPGKDQADLELLFARLGITTAEQAADIALAVYGEYSVVLPGRDELILSALEGRRCTP